MSAYSAPGDPCVAPVLNEYGQIMDTLGVCRDSYTGLLLNVNGSVYNRALHDGDPSNDGTPTPETTWSQLGLPEPLPAENPYVLSAEEWTTRRSAMTEAERQAEDQQRLDQAFAARPRCWYGPATFQINSADLDSIVSNSADDPDQLWSLFISAQVDPNAAPQSIVVRSPAGPTCDYENP